MSKPAKLPRIHEGKAVKFLTHKRGAISWTIVIIAAVISLLIWDFSDIIFSRQHRAEALTLIRPGMRLTEAERTLNSARYSTLYIAPPGQPPMLDVATGSRLPFTLQALKKLFPEWKGQKNLSHDLMQIAHFTIAGNPSGEVQATQEGKPLIINTSQTPPPPNPTATQ